MTRTLCDVVSRSTCMCSQDINSLAVAIQISDICFSTSLTRLEHRRHENVRELKKRSLSTSSNHSAVGKKLIVTAEIGGKREMSGFACRPANNIRTDGPHHILPGGLRFCRWQIHLFTTHTLIRFILGSEE